MFSITYENISKLEKFNPLYYFELFDKSVTIMTNTK